MINPFDKIALIGSGNVAYSFVKVLNNNGIQPYCVLVRNEESIVETEKSFGVRTTTDYEELRNCDLIVIAVKDDAIENVSKKINDCNALIVHTSGTKSSSILNHHENYGVMYPLQTFTKNFEVDFRDVPFLLTASSEENLKKLNSLAKLLSDVQVECSDEDRAYIHMSAVYVSNFVNVMLQIGSKLLEDKGLDISILKPLVYETINKSFILSPEKALTGPARRGDYETIIAHKMMLKDYIDECEIYELLTNYIMNINRKK